MDARLIVGVDGSEGALAAVAWAGATALRRHRSVHVMACYDIPIVSNPMGAPISLIEVAGDLEAGAKANLTRATDLLAHEAPGVAVTTAVVVGNAASSLADAAVPGDEVVVGASGRGGVLSHLLGSTATGLIHAAHVPVTVVRAAPGSVGKVVVGVDGSDHAKAALAWAYREAAERGAALEVVHAWTYPYLGSRTGIAEPREEMRLDAMHELEAAVADVAHLRDTCGPVSVHPRLVEASPGTALVDASVDADVVVVGSRGRGGIRAALLGSVSRQVIQHASCTVTVIRTDEGGS